MKTTRRNMVKVSGLAALLGGGFSGLAQKAPEVKKEIEKIVTVGSGDAAVLQQKITTATAKENATFEFLSSEFSFAGKLVKGAPYSAESTSETTQALADGNRIVRKNKATTYRDSEGRTRQEQTLGGIGPWAAGGGPQEMIFITDPVAAVSYVLDPQKHTARKIELPKLQAGAKQMIAVAVAASPGSGVEIQNVLEHGLQKVRSTEQAKTESLGKRTMEGLEAEGTRTTVTIPAGQIGNERPLEIVTERWYSPELQIVLFSKSSDPRMGDTVYRVTSINRSEPPRTLFDVPPDYTIQEAKGLIRRTLKKEE